MKKLTVIFAATMLVLGVVAVRLWGQLQDEREQLAALQSQITAIETAPPPVPAVQSVVALAPPAPVVEVVVPAAIKPDKPVQISPTPPGASTLSPMRRDLSHMMLARQYQDLARDLGLTQSEADRFIDLLARQMANLQNQWRDLKSMTPDQMLQLSREIKATQEAEQAAMLGSKFAQWQTYPATVQARDQVKDLQSRLAAGGNALSETQIGQMVAAMSSESTRFDKELTERAAAVVSVSQLPAYTYLQQTTDKNRRMIGAVSSYLSPAQLEGLRQMHAQKEESIRLEERAQQSVRDAQARGAGR